MTKAITTLTRKEMEAERSNAALFPSPGALRELRDAVRRVFASFEPEGDREESGFETARIVTADRSEDVFGDGARLRFFLRTGVAGDELILETSIDGSRVVASSVIGVNREKLAVSDLPTNIEKGVLAYFVERILAAVNEGAAFAAGVQPVTLCAVGTETGAPEWGGEGPGGWFALSGRATLAGAPLPWRLLLPRRVLEACRAAYNGGERAVSHEREMKKRLISRLGHRFVTLTGRLGEARLTGDDIGRLERDDIVLFDAGGCTFDRGVLGGTIRLAPAGSGGGAGSVSATIDADGEMLRVKVEEVVRQGDGPSEREDETLNSDQEKDREEDESERSAEEASGEAAETESEAGNSEETEGCGEEVSRATVTEEGAALAGRVPVVLRVEIGSVRMTLGELSRLSAGTVLELKKNVSAPVDLVVEDLSIGCGELVDVEGELGVRVLSLAE